MFTISTQNSKSNPCTKIMLLTHSMIVLFTCSTYPFCCGVCRALVCRWIPHSPKKPSIFLDTNSPLLLDHKFLIFVLVLFSTNTLYAMNLSNTSPFAAKVNMCCFRKVIDEGDNVSCSTTWCWFHESAHIGMHNFQKLWNLSHSMFKERCPLMFAFNAFSTHMVQCHFFGECYFASLWAWTWTYECEQEQIFYIIFLLSQEYSLINISNMVEYSLTTPAYFAMSVEYSNILTCHSWLL
jgi:hypothetical protein